MLPAGDPEKGSVAICCGVAADCGARGSS